MSNSLQALLLQLKVNSDFRERIASAQSFAALRDTLRANGFAESIEEFVDGYSVDDELSDLELEQLAGASCNNSCRVSCASRCLCRVNLV